MPQPQIIAPHHRRVVPLTELRILGKPKIDGDNFIAAVRALP